MGYFLCTDTLGAPLCEFCFYRHNLHTLGTDFLPVNCAKITVYRYLLPCAAGKKMSISDVLMLSTARKATIGIGCMLHMWTSQ